MTSQERLARIEELLSIAEAQLTEIRMLLKGEEVAKWVDPECPDKEAVAYWKRFYGEEL